MLLPIRGILPSFLGGLFSVSYSVYVLVLEQQMSLPPISVWDAWFSDNHWFSLSDYSDKKVGNRRWHWSWLYPYRLHRRHTMDIFYIVFRSGKESIQKSLRKWICQQVQTFTDLFYNCAFHVITPCDEYSTLILCVQLSLERTHLALTMYQTLSF